MVNESTTINIARYDQLKMESDFFRSNYVVISIDAFGNKKVWTKDQAIKDIENYHNQRLLEYKKKIRSMFTLKVWKWKLSLKIKDDRKG